jgi:hypothetical protein
MGGGSSRGTVTLTLPAPPGGMSVTLSSSDTAASVPESVVAPQGADTADFPIATQVVPNDRRALITSSIPGRSIASPREVWAVLPNFFWIAVDPPSALFNGGFRRYVSDYPPFVADCDRSAVQFQSLSINSSESWFLYFSAPFGQPLTVGTHDVPSSISSTTPQIRISGASLSCFGPGRFVIKDIQLTSFGQVRRFWATFESRCNGTAVGRGEVRITDGWPPSGSSIRSCTLR